MNAETLRSYIEKYKELGNYFEPEYKRKNPILTTFSQKHPKLNEALVRELTTVLSGDYTWEDKLFIADLLYLYKPIHALLLHPMLNCAAELPDPSFNRIFLTPCLASFGIPIISRMLARKFTNGEFVKKTRIATLLYWIRPKTNGENRELEDAILKRVNETSNLVELYFYQLYFSYQLKKGMHIPRDAAGLIEAIDGNPVYEDLVFNKLKWRRTK